MAKAKAGLGVPTAGPALCGPRRSPARNTLPAHLPVSCQCVQLARALAPCTNVNRRGSDLQERHTFVRLQTRVEGTRGEAGSQLLRGDAARTPLALASPRTPAELGAAAVSCSFSPAPLSPPTPPLWDPDPEARQQVAHPSETVAQSQNQQESRNQDLEVHGGLRRNLTGSERPQGSQSP